MHFKICEDVVEVVLQFEKRDGINCESMNLIHTFSSCLHLHILQFMILINLKALSHLKATNENLQNIHLQMRNLTWVTRMDCIQNNYFNAQKLYFYAID